MTHTITVLRLKTAKAIINRCYEADKSTAISSEGLSVHGNSIDAAAIKFDYTYLAGYTVTINSIMFELATLKSLVADAYAAIEARRQATR